MPIQGRTSPAVPSSPLSSLWASYCHYRWYTPSLRWRQCTVAGDGGPRHTVALGWEGDKSPPPPRQPWRKHRGGLHGSKGEAVPSTPLLRAAVQPSATYSHPSRTPVTLDNLLTRITRLTFQLIRPLQLTVWLPCPKVIHTNHRTPAKALSRWLGGWGLRRKVLQDRTYRVEATRCEIRFLSRVTPLTSQPCHSPTRASCTFHRLGSEVLGCRSILSLTSGHTHHFLVGACSLSPALASEIWRVQSGKPIHFRLPVGPSCLQPPQVCCCTPLHSLPSHACTHTQVWAHVTHLPDPPSNQPEYRNNWFKQPGWGDIPCIPLGRGEMALSPGQDGPYTH